MSPTPKRRSRCELAKLGICCADLDDYEFAVNLERLLEIGNETLHNPTPEMKAEWKRDLGQVAIEVRRYVMRIGGIGAGS